MVELIFGLYSPGPKSVEGIDSALFELPKVQASEVFDFQESLMSLSKDPGPGERSFL